MQSWSTNVYACVFPCVCLYACECVYSGVCRLADAACQRTGILLTHLAFRWSRSRRKHTQFLFLPEFVTRNNLSPAMHSNYVTLCWAQGKEFRLAKGSQPHLRSLNLQRGTCLNTHTRSWIHTQVHVSGCITPYSMPK